MHACDGWPSYHVELLLRFLVKRQGVSLLHLFACRNGAFYLFPAIARLGVGETYCYPTVVQPAGTIHYIQSMQVLSNI